LNNNQHYLTHSPIDVYFKQSKEDFVVTEIPLYEFSGEGEHLIIKLRKKDLTTWDALEIIAKAVGCRTRDIGYAGLKDKNAMTIQHISIHKQYEEKLKKFEHNQIKFLEMTYHNNKIKIGHLKGNNFFIRLKRVLTKDVIKLESVLGSIAKNGIANYFGFQRFGIDGDNYKKGEQIIAGTLKEKNKKLKQMYLNAYQSYGFNKWLSRRIEISKLIDSFESKELESMLDIPLEELKQMKKQEHPFKIMKGELMSHYPFGKIFCADDLESEAEKFNLRDRVPTGFLSGKKAKKPEETALKFEEQIIETTNFLDGTRRFAWIFPSDINSEYKEEKNHFELSFTLPKGSYATEVIRELIH
jgi:tRNA pseudouridine13 synthase